MQTQHRWRFYRAGGLDQVRLETGADIANLAQLDQKLWVALACPVKGLEFDEKTLALLDTDKDGRVRAPEILEAVKFCNENLVDLDGLLKGTDEVPLGKINGATDAGKAMLAAIKRILHSLGKDASSSISLADVADTTKIFANTRFNGDAIITPKSTDDAELSKVIEEIGAALGTELDRSGVPGIGQPKVDAFFEQLAAVDAWHKASEADAATTPFGDKTGAAAAAVKAVRAKVDDYFARCALVVFDARSQTAMNHVDTDFAPLSAKSLSAGAAEIASFPLARIEPNRPLPLDSGINPAWQAAIATFKSDAVGPVLGGVPASLTEAQWKQICDRLAAHDGWLAKKPDTKVEGLGLERIRALLAGASKKALTELVDADKATQAEFDAITAVERLLRYHRDLFRLLHNFVSFTDFYAPERIAVFQAGTLFLDSRSCELTVKVIDAGKHAAMAGLAKCYLAYCDCVRPNGEKMQIAAVFSAGDSDYLMVGRNGVFYDRQGRDWDATITKVIENPISLREAFFSPYKKFVRFVEEQVAKRAAAADADATTKLAAAADTTANVDKSKPPAPGFDMSTIALIGVAASGAAAVLGGLLQAFFGLGILMPLGILAIVLAISGPSMLIAALKLRQRNLGPILDANGWAVNGRVAVNIPFGGSLTQLPVFPQGSQRSVIDPYQPPRSPWVTLAWIGVALGIFAGSAVLGYHKGWFPEVVEQNLAFLGVPKHLIHEKEAAQASVDEQKVVLASAQEQQTAAQATLDAMVASAEPNQARLVRAQNRLVRADAKLARAEDKLDVYEERLENATEALDIAIDANEARLEAAEAAEPVTPAP